MNTKLFVVGFSICALLTISGCKEEQTSTDSPAPKSAENMAPMPTAPPIAQTVSQAVVNVEKETNAVLQSTNVAVPQVQAVQLQAQASEAQAQSIIDRAKSLYNDKKYQDALASLAGLSNLQLTPEQQKLVSDLKTQIQSALTKTTTGDAASALGGVLGDKK